MSAALFPRNCRRNKTVDGDPATTIFLDVSPFYKRVNIALAHCKLFLAFP